MPKKRYVTGNPDDLGVSPELQDRLVQMAEDYMAGRPAPEAPPATAGIPLAEPARAEQQEQAVEHPRSTTRPANGKQRLPRALGFLRRRERGFGAGG